MAQQVGIRYLVFNWWVVIVTISLEKELIYALDYQTEALVSNYYENKSIWEYKVKILDEVRFWIMLLL